MIHYNNEFVDIHTFCMATSLKKLSIPHRLDIISGIHANKELKHSVVFHVSGSKYAYKGGVLRKRVQVDNQFKYVNFSGDADLFVSDKHRTKQHLSSKKIKTPMGKVFRRRALEKALSTFSKLDKPVCVKPNNGRGGDRVFTNISQEHQFLQALLSVAQKYVNIIVEEHVEGEHFRFFYVKPCIVGIKLGIPFSIVGDGISTVQTLLKRKNEERKARNCVTHPPLEFSDKMQLQLNTQNLHLEGIPEKDRTVFLKSSAGLDEGADAILLELNDIHPSYINIVESACASIPSLTIAGIDIVIEDRIKPANNNYAILEINANPALSPFYFPWKGKEIDIGSRIIDMLKNNIE